MVDALQAGGYGLAAGSMLVVGACIAWFARVPGSVTAGVMAFGAGVLISALAYELVEEANRDGGLFATVAGFFVGVFPGNIAHWVSRRDVPGLDSDDKRFARLFLQPVLVWLAWWSTRRA